MLVVDIVLFAHLAWLGLYLLNRSRSNGTLRAIAMVNLWFAIVVALIATVAKSRPEWELDSALAPTVLILLGAFAYIVAGRSSDASDPNEQTQRRSFIALAGTTALVFSITTATAAIVFDLHWIQLSTALLTVVAITLIVGGLYAVRRESIAEGESYILDVTRSYDYSLLIAVVFGGQVALAMWTGPGATTPMVTLLLGTITAAIAIQVFLDRVQSMLDHIAFANASWLRKERADLRRVENALPRVNMTDPLTIPEDEFPKLTRRALSNYGDLTKLATSPLTNLPEVHRRLAVRDVEPSTLERARELKVLLAEAIERLKPRSDDGVGTTDEWRFYNALYFPYIVGMRPYSTTAVHSFDSPGYDDVLDWFRIYVPERTLYNWQNAAAALIAGHLREQEEIAVGPDSVPARQLSTVS